MAELGSRTFRARLFAVVALAALAATYLTPLINADWNAWRYNHGHASLASVVHEHEHPWESGSTQAGDDESNDFVFTSSDDSTPGLTAIWRTAPLEVTVALHAHALDRSPVAASPANPTAPAPPPPEVALSRA